MRIWSRIRSWLQAVTRRSRMESEMDAELRFHIEAFAEDLARKGVPRAEAVRRARIEFGGVERAKEECREARGVSFVESFMQDSRFGLRMLRKNLGFTVVAVLTLALGIGANTAIFSIVNGVLLRPLPYPESGRIVQIRLQAANGFIPDLTVPQFVFLRDHGALAFDGVAGFQGWETLELRQRDRITWLKGLRISSDFFRVLGIRPAVGSEFTLADTQPGAPLSIVLSDASWRTSFGASREIIGKQVRLNDSDYTVAGVLPRDFVFLEDPVDAFIPLQPSESLGDRGFNTSTIARLKPGMNSYPAQAAMTALFPQFPDKNANLLGLTIVSYQRWLTGDIRPSLLVLFGAVGLLLLIACVNVASLTLARTYSRTREISIRLAIGASRSRLLRQLLAESLLMAVIAAGVGLAAAWWTLNALASTIPWDLHVPASSIRVDGAVLAFGLAAAVLASILFGLASFWQITRTNVNAGPKEGLTRGSAGVSHSRTRNVLVVTEVALSLMLLVGAAMLAESLYHLHQEKLGFDPANVVNLSIAYPRDSNVVGQRFLALEQQLTTRFQAVPGVRSVGVVNVAPLAGQGNVPAQLAGYNDAEHSIGPMEIRRTDRRYFETMRIPILTGRTFQDSDASPAPLVAVINETLARRWWKDKSPIGDHIIIGRFMGRDLWQPPPPGREIVGVVGDVKGRLLTQPARPMVYIPVAQAEDMNAPGEWMIRVANGINLGLALRQAVSDINPEMRITSLRSMSSVVAGAVANQRFEAALMALFAGMALALASVGIYGVLSLYVSQRNHEIGIRMALGAESRQVLRLVLGQGFVLALIGVVIGVAAALGLMRFLKGLLYGVSVASITPYVAGSLILILVALLASYIPARRAMRVDPMVALRYE